MKKFYNIEGMIRNGFKLSRDYETLDFSYASFTDAAAESLAKSRSIKQVRRITITGKKLTAVAAKAFGASETMGRLESLKLYKNKVGDEGVKYFTESDKLVSLKSLRLSWNNIGPQGAKYFADSTNMTSLTSQIKLARSNFSYSLNRQNIWLPVVQCCSRIIVAT